MARSVRLTGVAMTRSKSERARLLMLAQDVVEAEEARLEKPTGMRMMRSAASQLALDMYAGVSL